MARFAAALGFLGRVNDAIDIRKSVLEVEERIHAIDHPQRLAATYELAAVFERTGRLKEAADLQLEVVQIYAQKLGVNHPNTLSAMNNLVSTLSSMGQQDKAMRMLRVILQEQENSLVQIIPIQ
jgi:tetratricopeptide (TPR) repeat protein